MVSLIFKHILLMILLDPSFSDNERIILIEDLISMEKKITNHRTFYSDL